MQLETHPIHTLVVIGELIRNGSVWRIECGKVKEERSDIFSPLVFQLSGIMPHRSPFSDDLYYRFLGQPIFAGHLYSVSGKIIYGRKNNYAPYEIEITLDIDSITLIGEKVDDDDPQPE